ncbi:RHS repeat domain-containing protein [Flavobacterium reichenbachii]|uniref:RHS repeat domain-containing protein n=1 Tax=Flavobacterium reichenbachii TaxID=362418 RepID=UPI000B5C1272|nr:RHS repeat domain-containing protein [Flavobacterium reichenbachii]OXB15793.1 hypothetical protein B0A68_09005 [Flavobacterium reichenbachii]
MKIGLGIGTHYAKTTIDYRNTPYYDNSNPIEINENIQIGGIRVAKTTDCPNHLDNNCIIKQYKYVDNSNNLISSGYLTQSHPRFISKRIAKLNIRGQFAETLGGSLLIYNQAGWESYISHTESFRPLTSLTSLGSHILYKNVKIINQDESLGKSENEYSIAERSVYSDDFPTLYTDVDFAIGKVLSQNLFENKSGNLSLKQTQQNIYVETIINPSNYASDYQIKRAPEEITVTDPWTGSVGKESAPNTFLIGSVKHFAKEYQVNSTETKLIQEGQTINTKTDYKYDPSTGYKVETKILNSNGSEVINKTYYPIILPEFIQMAKGTNNLDDRIQFHDYYSNGNLKEVSLKNGTHTIYLWGYNKQYPIAKIENCSNSQVILALDVSSLENVNENNLNAINNLRNSLPDAMVSTFSYIPLVGISTMTDPKGQTTTYTYDSLGRLEFVKDAQGNLLSQNQYHYKN